MRIETEEVRSHDSQLVPGEGVYDALVLDARLRQSLVTVRSLGRRGLRVAALETLDELPAPAFSSRWCQHKVVCSVHEGTREHLASLEQALEATGARVLIVSSDGTIEMIRRYRQRLEQRVRVALAQEPALAIAVNKERTLEVARRLGVSVPRAVTIREVSEVGAALHEIGLPAVVKPAASWTGDEQRGVRVASRLVTTAEEARRAVAELTHCGGTTLFQQFIAGRRESLSFLYAQGQMYARFAQWVKRSDPPLGGTIVVRQSIALPPDVGEQGEQLVREIELEGYAEVEFRRDSDGHPYLMEINPRLNASIEVAVRAGIDFPYLLYQWVTGERLDVVEGYRPGVWMRHLGGDISTTIASVRQRGRPGVTPPVKAIGQFCTSFFVPMGYDYVDWRDPLPVWTAARGYPRQLWRQAKERFSEEQYSANALSDVEGKSAINSDSG